jgi:hypothetical protein
MGIWEGSDGGLWLKGDLLGDWVLHEGDGDFGGFL